MFRFSLLTCCVLAGCAGGHGGDKGLQQELADSRAQTAAERARIQALEVRLAEAEQRAPAQVTDRRLVLLVDRLIQQNEALMTRLRSGCDTDSKRPLPTTADFDAAPDSEQMRQLEQRLRAYAAGRKGGLSREQREAMRLLLLRDRILDPSDPFLRR